jgi:hypothetical protein
MAVLHSLAWLLGFNLSVRIDTRERIEDGWLKLEVVGKPYWSLCRHD